MEDKTMKKRAYKKLGMQVVKVQMEQHLLANSGTENMGMYQNQVNNGHLSEASQKKAEESRSGGFSIRPQ